MIEGASHWMMKQSTQPILMKDGVSPNWQHSVH